MSYTLEIPDLSFVRDRIGGCRACGRREMETFGESPNVPVTSARVFADPSAARSVPRGAIALALCRGCGFIGNVRFDGARVAYAGSYEEQQRYSPTLDAFNDQIALDLIERLDLHGKRIVEIGCGKGEFLAQLCELGDNVGLGLDPTAAAGRVSARAARRVTLRPEFYGFQTGALDADAVICRHTLEHVADARSFVRLLRGSLAASPGARVYIEVPDAGRVLREAAFWDVFYEHCSYYTEESLARLFRREDFVVDDVRLGFDRQFILLTAHVPVENERIASLTAFDPLGDIVAIARAYQPRVRAAAHRWAQRVRSLRAAGKRVVMWGSDSTCVAFLNQTGLGEDVDAVVDVNPHRQGRYLPLSADRVRPPTDLVALRPDLVLVTNQAYLAESRAMLTALDLDPEVEAVG